MSHHNEICCRVTDLDSKTLVPTYGSYDPLIQLRSAVQIFRYPLARSYPPNNTLVMTADYEQKGYLLIRVMCAKGTDLILDMRVVYTDVMSYVLMTPEKILLIMNLGET